jgi:hypothetical protein
MRFKPPAYMLTSMAARCATASGTKEEELASFFCDVEVPLFVDADSSIALVSLSGLVSESADFELVSDWTRDIFGDKAAAAALRSL